MPTCRERAIFFAGFNDCLAIENEAKTYVTANQDKVAEVYSLPMGAVTRYFYDSVGDQVVACPSPLDTVGGCDETVVQTLNNGGYCLPYVDALLFCNVAYILAETSNEQIEADALISMGLGDYASFTGDKKPYISALYKLYRAVLTVDRIIANNGLLCEQLDDAQLRLLLLYALNPTDEGNKKAINELLEAQSMLIKKQSFATTRQNNQIFGVDHG